MEEYSTFIAIIFYGKAWWVRLSAQVYLTIEDFEWAGKVLKEVCERVQKGRWKGMSPRTRSASSATECRALTFWWYDFFVYMGLRVALTFWSYRLHGPEKAVSLSVSTPSTMRWLGGARQLSIHNAALSH